MVESGPARIRVVASAERPTPVEPAVREDTTELVLDDGTPQLLLDVEASHQAPVAAGAALAPLAPLPGGSGWAPPGLSYSGLDLHARCPYRFQVERMLGVPKAEAGGAAAVGKAVHRAIETGGDPGELLAAAAPDADPADPGRARDALVRWQGSPLAQRFAGLDLVAHEQPFLLALGPATVTGYFDLAARDGDLLVIGDVKVADLKGLTPDARRDEGYAVQEQCYALAALESGVDRVEVCFQWVGDDAAAGAMAARTFTAADRDGLRAGLEARVAAALTGPWEPTPSETACAGCPALGMLCAGPALGRRG
ncbi:MAG: PD-(D/E)XK nuclease family protein [Actinomycetota bacterium]